MPHGGNQCPLCFTVRLGFILILLQFAPNGNFIFSRLMRIIDPLQATSSSIWPCRRASLAKSNAPVIELTAPLFSFFPKLLGLLFSIGVAFLVTPCDEEHFASLRRSLKASVHQCWCCFFFVTPLDELPVASSLIVHWLWCCFSCDAWQRTAFCIFSDAFSRLLFICDGVPFAVTPWTNGLLHPF